MTVRDSDRFACFLRAFRGRKGMYQAVPSMPNADNHVKPTARPRPFLQFHDSGWGLLFEGFALIVMYEFIQLIFNDVVYLTRPDVTWPIAAYTTLVALATAFVFLTLLHILTLCSTPT